jgi:hypothetical protein
MKVANAGLQLVQRVLRGSLLPMLALHADLHLDKADPVDRAAAADEDGVRRFLASAVSIQYAANVAAERLDWTPAAFCG